MNKSKKQRKFEKDLIKIELIFLFITLLFSLMGFMFISYEGDLSATITGFASFSIYPLEPEVPTPPEEIINETFILPAKESVITEEEPFLEKNPREESLNETEVFTAQFEFEIMAAPTQGTPILNSTNPATNDTNQNLTCWNQSTADADGDTVKSIFNWYRNNVSIMKLYMPFENHTLNASKYALDYSGNNNNGTVTGATWNASGGVDGFGAYEFDGINDEIDITPSAGGFGTLVGRGSHTITLLVKTNIGSTRQYPFSDHDSAGTNQAIAFEIQADNTFRYNLVGGSTSTIDGGTVSADTWYHIALRFDNSTQNQSLYVDGAIAKSAIAGFSVLNTGTDGIIGRPGDYNGLRLNGTIDDIRFYNFTLSAAQIKRLYENDTHIIVSNETSTGDSWKCEVTPNDGTTDGTAKNSSELEILEIYPTTTLEKPTDANETAGYVDVEFNCSATTTSLYALTNITLYGNWTGTWYANETNTVSGTLNSTTFKKNVTKGKWYLWNCLTYNDGAFSDWGDSNYTFYANSMPTQGTPELFSTNNATNATSTNLTCYNISTADIDGDTVKSIFNWYRDGVSIMKLYMPFEENGSSSASSTAKDYSDQGNDGTVTSATFSLTGGIDGFGAYSFDGGNDYIQLTDDASLRPSTISVFAWINKDTNAGRNIIFACGDVDAYTTNNYILEANGDTDIRVLGRTDSKIITASSNITVGAWYHVGFINNGSDTTIYVNGMARITDTQAIGTDDTTGCKIGQGSGTILDLYFKGTIDEVRMYNFTLSEAQIKRLYENDTHIIISNETLAGDSWKCEVTPNDGTTDGTAKNSSELEILSNVAPIVSLVFPSNNTYIEGTQSVNLTYNVTDPNSGDTVDNCTLWLSTVNTTTLLNNKTDTAITQDVNQSFNRTLLGGNYNWQISCKDDNNAQGNMTTNNFSVYPEAAAANTAPEVHNITIEPSTAYTNSLLHCNTTIYDSDGNSLTVNMTWWNGTDYYSKHIKSGASSGDYLNFTLTPGIQSNGETWNCSVVVNDGTVDSALNSTTITISNAAPTGASTAIYPSTAYTGSILSGNITVTDIDNEVVQINCTWYNGTVAYSSVNQSVTSTSGQEINYSLTEGIQAKDETWNISFIGCDTGGSCFESSTTVTIGNTAPSVGSVTFEPATAYTNSILNGTVTITDADGGTLTTNATWYNGTAAYISRNISSASGAEINYSLTEGIQAKGETWNISFVTCDSSGLCDEGSAVKTISSTAPTQDTPELWSTNNQTNNTYQNLTCYNLSTADIDGDTVKSIFNWYRNNVSIMKLYMPFENHTLNASKYALDYSGNNNNGTVTGATWNASGGVDGFGAYEFDGDDYINLGTKDSLNPDLITISYWVKGNLTGTQDVVAMSNSAANIFWRTFFNAGKFEYGWEPSASNWRYYRINDSASGGVNFTNTTWYHIAVTYDIGNAPTGTPTFYVNGAQVGSYLRATTGTGTKPATQVTSIGRLGDYNGFYFNGTIDDVRIYNRSLSAEQIKRLYENDTHIIVSNETSTGDSWHCEVTPNDGTIDGTSANSSELEILNTVPTVDNITIEPSTAYTNSLLHCNVTVYDADGNSLTVYMNWTNGTTHYAEYTKTGASSGDYLNFTLDSGIQFKDEIWNCSASIHDGTELGALNSTTITISNTAPSLSSVTFEPTTAYTDSILNGSVTITDGDGDAITTNATWYNGTTAYISLNISSSAGAEINYSLIEGIQFKDETWNISFVTCDSSGLCDEGSAVKTITNTEPITNITSPANGTSSETQETLFVYNVTDIDDDISNCTLWIENSTGLAIGEINTSITVDIDQNFTITLPYETINWSVECIDSSNAKDNSTKFVYTVTEPVEETPSGGEISRGSTSYGYELNIDKLELKLYAKGKEIIRMINTGNREVTVSLDLQELSKYITLSEDSFILEPNEIKEIILEVNPDAEGLIKGSIKVRYGTKTQTIMVTIDALAKEPKKVIVIEEPEEKIKIEEEWYTKSTFILLLIAISGSIIVFGALVFYEKYKKTKIIIKHYEEPPESKTPKVVDLIKKLPIKPQAGIPSKFNDLFVKTLEYLDRNQYHKAEENVNILKNLYDKHAIDPFLRYEIGVLIEDLDNKIRFGVLKQKATKGINEYKIKKIKETKVKAKKIRFKKIQEKRVLTETDKQLSEAHKLIKSGKYSKARKLLK